MRDGEKGGFSFLSSSHPFLFEKSHGMTGPCIGVLTLPTAMWCHFLQRKHPRLSEVDSRMD